MIDRTDSLEIIGGFQFYHAMRILEETLKNGGFSMEEHNSGYMVSIKESEQIIECRDNSKYDICDIIVDYYNFYGTVNTWLDTSKVLPHIANDGTIYLDVSIHVETLKEAIRIGKDNDQLSIYDCKNKTVITL